MKRSLFWVAFAIGGLACSEGEAIEHPSAASANAEAEEAALIGESEAPRAEAEELTEAEEAEELAEAEAATEATEIAESPYQCVVPPIPIPRPQACDRGRGYPACKWQMPWDRLSEGRYRRWRNTIVEHWWGRPSLVSLILAASDDFERIYPEQELAVGDLDAPGPRHNTHKTGVNVDLYLLGAMRVENAGAGRYPNNYEGKPEEEVRALQDRVLELAKILATCTQGQILIYYNDEAVIERFHAWYDRQGYAENAFGRPMQGHNDLHEFHFHITIPDDLPALPQAPLPEGERHPRAEILPPPPPESAPNLSSMNRQPGQWGAVPRE